MNPSCITSNSIKTTPNIFINSTTTTISTFSMTNFIVLIINTMTM